MGSIICGRGGVTDADLMVKAFTPTFTAEDLTKTPNHAAICKVMMFGMPTSAFTMNLPAPMGEPSDELMESLKVYSATKYARTRAEVEKEINDRWSVAEAEKNAESGAREGGSKGSSEGSSGLSASSVSEKRPLNAVEAARSGGSSISSISSGVGGLSASSEPVKAEKGFLDDWLAENPVIEHKKPEPVAATPVNTSQESAPSNEQIFRVR